MRDRGTARYILQIGPPENQRAAAGSKEEERAGGADTERATSGAQFSAPTCTSPTSWGRIGAPSTTSSCASASFIMPFTCTSMLPTARWCCVAWLERTTCHACRAASIHAERAGGEGSIPGASTTGPQFFRGLVVLWVRFVRPFSRLGDRRPIFRWTAAGRAPTAPRAAHGQLVPVPARARPRALRRYAGSDSARPARSLRHRVHAPR